MTTKKSSSVANKIKKRLRKSVAIRPIMRCKMIGTDLTHTCFWFCSCGLKIARSDRTKIPTVLESVGDARLRIQVNEAPRVRCPCGKVSILLEGSL